MSRQELVALLYEALGTPLGIAVNVIGDPQSLKGKLYGERKRIGDPDLSQLTLTVDPNNPQIIWIIRRAPKGQASPPDGDASALPGGLREDAGVLPHSEGEQGD